MNHTSLKKNYEKQWAAIKKDDWVLKIKILAVLIVVREPISIDLMCKYIQCDEKSRVYSFLEEIDQFLHKTQSGKYGVQYKISDQSFLEFVENKEGVREVSDQIRFIIYESQKEVFEIRRNRQRC